MPCRLLCKSTKRLPGFSSGSLLSGILPRDMQYSITTALQVPHSSNSDSALHAFNKLNLICVLKIPLLLLQSLLWKVGENTYRKEKNLQKHNLKHEIHLPYIHLLHCPVLSQSYGTTNHSAGGDTNAGTTSYHYHCFDYCYDYDSEWTSDQDRQQQQQQHISVGMLPRPVALAGEGCHNMPCAICYSICWSIYKNLRLYSGSTWNIQESNKLSLPAHSLQHLHFPWKPGTITHQFSSKSFILKFHGDSLRFCNSFRCFTRIVLPFCQ